MVTFLDITLFKHIYVIFPVLLVFCLVFAILEKTKLLGENRGIHSLIALVVAIMMLFSPGVVKVISILAPWFVLMFIFYVLVVLVFKFLGVTDASIVEVMTKEWGTIHWFVLFFAIIALVAALGSVYGAFFLPYTAEEEVPKAIIKNITEEGVYVGPPVEGVPAEEVPEKPADYKTATGEFNRNVARVVFHPKVIGLVFILIVASFTIRMLAGKPE